LTPWPAPGSETSSGLHRANTKNGSRFRAPWSRNSLQNPPRNSRGREAAGLAIHPPPRHCQPSSEYNSPRRTRRGLRPQPKALRDGSKMLVKKTRCNKIAMRRTPREEENCHKKAQKTQKQTPRSSGDKSPGSALARLPRPGWIPIQSQTMAYHAAQVRRGGVVRRASAEPGDLSPGQRPTGWPAARQRRANAENGGQNGLAVLAVHSQSAWKAEAAGVDETNAGVKGGCHPYSFPGSTGVPLRLTSSPYHP
jgi:hypothetical protein